MSVIDDVKQKTDIVEVIGQYATLKKAGRNLTALCPFHSEKNPSFFVYPERQSWHCFGACNTGGDVLSFIMKKENMDFGEALRLLAGRAGIEIPTRSEPDTRKDERDRLFRINEAAALYFHNLLLNSPAAEKARSYLEGRGLTQKAVSDFQLGFSLNSWEVLKEHMLEKGYTEAEMVEAGLLVESDDGKTHDRFRNRLIFTISDSRGRTTGFGARVLDDSLPKYVNSPQSAVFDKSGTLYGINLASQAIRQQDQAVVVEGYMDVITAHQNGFTNVVASMGTAITEKQVAILKRLTRNIVLALDADTAGEAAMKQGGELASRDTKNDLEELEDVSSDTLSRSLNQGDVRKKNIFGPVYFGQKVFDTDVSVLLLPNGKDPDNVIKDGSNDWQQMVSKSVPVLDYLIDQLVQKLDLTTARDKSIALQEILPVLFAISDPIKHIHYLQKLSQMVNISTRELEETYRGMQPRKVTNNRDIRSNQPLKVDRAIRSLTYRPIEEQFLALILQHPEFREATGSIPLDYFESSENREIFTAWRQAESTESLRDNLDITLRENLDTLVNKNILATKVEERYNDYVLRLREEYLRGLARKRATSSEAEGTTAELPGEQDIEVSSSLREVFNKRARREGGKGERR